MGLRACYPWHPQGPRGKRNVNPKQCDPPHTLGVAQMNGKGYSVPMSRYQNADGEYTMTAAEMAYEDSLDSEPSQWDPWDDYGPEDFDDEDDDNDDDGLTDAEADAMTLTSAGWGTDEDYGYFGDSDFFGEG